MKWRFHIGLIAAVTLAIQGICFCATVTPSCNGPSCASHEEQGCHEHQPHGGAGHIHVCCHSAVCEGGAEVTADSELSTPYHASLVFALYGPLFAQPNATCGRFPSPAQGCAPPSGVPIFLSIRALLI